MSLDKPSKINESDIKIKVLSEEDKQKIYTFKCYEQDLVDFLRDDAFNNQIKKISTTYLWYLENELIAYITILTDSINLNPLLKTQFRREGIYYKSLPALKIGRLCVQDNYAKRGIGTKMIFFAIAKAIEINKIAGCRFLTLDAKSDSSRFYKKMGFSILKERKKGTIPMYKDLLKIIEEIDL